MQWEQLSFLNPDFPYQSQPFDLPISGYGSRNSEFHAFRHVRGLKFMEDMLGGSGAHFP